MHIYIIMHSLYKAVSQNVWLWSILKCKTKLGNIFYIKIIGQESICLYGFFVCRTFKSQQLFKVSQTYGS